MLGTRNIDNAQPRETSWNFVIQAKNILHTMISKTDFEPFDFEKIEGKRLWKVHLDWMPVGSIIYW